MYILYKKLRWCIVICATNVSVASGVWSSCAVKELLSFYDRLIGWGEIRRGVTIKLDK